MRALSRRRAPALIRRGLRPTYRMPGFESVTLTHGRYDIEKSLREKILFAKHNLLRDPPFSQLDLESCRNLLIYLDRTAQRQVLETFHFALQPGGHLFLGSSESAKIADDLFAAIDTKNRNYRARVLASARTAAVLPVTDPLKQPTHFYPVAPVIGRANASFAALHRSAMERYAPPSVLIDARRTNPAYVRGNRSVPSLRSRRTVSQSAHPDQSGLAAGATNCALPGAATRQKRRCGTCEIRAGHHLLLYQHERAPVPRGRPQGRACCLL